MSRTDYYAQVLSQVPNGLPRLVFGLLMQHAVGYKQRVSRPWLARVLQTHDRTVREAIEVLRKEYHVPVMSASGLSGYWLAEDEAERAEFLKEIQARIDNLVAVRDAVRAAQIPSKTELVEVKQLALL